MAEMHEIKKGGIYKWYYEPLPSEGSPYMLFQTTSDPDSSRICKIKVLFCSNEYYRYEDRLWMRDSNVEYLGASLND